MGIHNEPGCRILSPQPTLPALIEWMLDQLLDTSDVDRAYVDFSDAQDIVVMVNNLGGTSPLEFDGITTNVLKALGMSAQSKPLKVACLHANSHACEMKFCDWNCGIIDIASQFSEI
jgi:dihydroxyacetone kinase